MQKDKQTPDILTKEEVIGSLCIMIGTSGSTLIRFGIEETKPEKGHSIVHPHRSLSFWAFIHQKLYLYDYSLEESTIKRNKFFIFADPLGEL